MAVGLKAGHSGRDASPGSIISCRLVFPGATEEATREVLGGSDLPRLDLGIFLESSTAPTALSLLWQGDQIPTQVRFPIA